MPSKLDLLSALMLAALLQCAPAVEDATGDNPAGDPSGEEGERPSDLLSASSLWDLVSGLTKHCQNEIEYEFPSGVVYSLGDRISSLPERCPKSNFSKEACLQSMVQGLHTYTVLLKGMEEYSSSLIQASQIRMYLVLLISLIKVHMTDPSQVPAMTSSQEEQLLKDINDTNTFHRKMTSIKILRKLHNFISDSKRSIKRWERPRRSMAYRVMAPVSYYQKLKR